ncbi:MAG: glycosyltransferase [Candidatus Omnitrophota bacterium]
MRVSIIIAVKASNDRLKECIKHCLKLNYKDYEILVLPDHVFSYQDERVHIIPTGPCLPAKKRDIGWHHAQGDILAFLDDDAYPSEKWLDYAVRNFEDSQVAAVGGAAVTPPTESFMRMASGLVYESFAVSGNFKYRYAQGKRCYIDDYPSCNLLVRKDVFAKIGGFRTKFWPGEDTILCLEITKKLKKKIVYDPEALVFHHRRSLFADHLKQIQNYALHRGYFVKRFPETSLRWQYFMPSVLLLWFVFGFIASVFSLFFSLFYIMSLLCYGGLLFLSSYDPKDLRMSRYVCAGIFLTHLYYGFHFIEGLLASKLKEEKR